MLLSLINDILDFSKIEAGKLKIVESDYQAMGVAPEVIDGAIRISFGRDNTMEDIDRLKTALLDAIGRL